MLVLDTQPSELYKKKKKDARGSFRADSDTMCRRDSVVSSFGRVCMPRGRGGGGVDVDSAERRVEAKVWNLAVHRGWACRWLCGASGCTIPCTGRVLGKAYRSRAC